MKDLGLIAVVALERMCYLDAKRVEGALRALAPRRAVRVFDREHSSDESGLVVWLDGHEFAVMTIDGRLPEPDFEKALAPSVFWPAAPEVMDRHKAFVVVAPSRPATEPATTIAQAAAQTRIVGMLCELYPVLGCFWEGASSAVPPERVRQAVGDLYQNKWPADLWIGYVYRASDTEGGLFTGIRSSGARPYLGVELDIPPRHVRDHAEIQSYLYRALSDLISRGCRVRDGEPVRMTNSREAWHQVRYIATGRNPVVTLRELDEPIWGFANVSR